MPGGSSVFLLLVVLLILGSRLHRRPSPPSSGAADALYSELLRTPFRIARDAELEVFLQPDALEFGWRSWAVDKIRAAGTLPRFAFNDLLWVRLRPDEIVKLEPRRLSTPHYLLEWISPYAGLGFTGEKKYRIRGVRTGIFIRTTAGKRYWLATRHPDELIAAIEAARDPEQGPPLPPPRTT